MQAVVLPISEHHHEYAQGVQDVLEEAGFRVECDLRNEKIGYKIREAQLLSLIHICPAGSGPNPG